MNAKLKMLFGIHDLQSSRQALAEAGELLKEMPNLELTLFHGFPDPQISMLAKLLRMTPEAVEEYQKTCSLEEKKILDQAKDVLVESGLEAAKVAAICEARCHDPAVAMLNLANSGDLDPIVLARRKQPLLERLLMGPVTYRVVQLAEWRSVWLIDSPLVSHDILVTLVGAPISHRVVEHAVKYLSHLKGSRFTFLHIIPPVPPVFWDHTRIFDKLERKEREVQKRQWMKEYSDLVKKIADTGQENLRRAGIRDENVAFKILPARRGMAGDILAELESGKYGVLVIGRKGSKELSPFRLGSIADKLLHNAQNCMICLVN
jgi:nucleotide-binding universal stress UspA family protein